MAKSLKSASIISSVLSAVFLIAALATWPAGRMPWLADRGLRVEPRVRDVGAVPLGANLVVDFILTNLGIQAVDVLGSTSTCSRQACLNVGGLPTRIKARESRKISVYVKTNGGGRLADEVVLFTDDAEQREVALRVVGHVIGGLSGSDATD